MHYVIDSIQSQHVLERGKRNERSQIISKLGGHIVQMSQHKFASNVVEKCLEHGDISERELLIKEIVGRNEGNDNLLVRIIKSTIIWLVCIQDLVTTIKLREKISPKKEGKRG